MYDPFAEIDRHSRAGTRDLLPETLAKRFTQADASVDGVLCWDIFDFLDVPAAKALAREVVRVLRPELFDKIQELKAEAAKKAATR